MKATIGWFVFLAVAVGMLLVGTPNERELSTASQAAQRKPSGYPQLISVEQLPATNGEMCSWEPASASTRAKIVLQERFAPQTETPGQKESSSIPVDRAPVRVIRDNYPTYSAVAVDTKWDEVFLQDENLTGFNVFNRLDNTPPTATMTEPKRKVSGSKTKMDFNCGLYVDPNSGDVYSVNNDFGDTMVVFPHAANGDVAPMRELHTPHRAYGIAVDEEAQELFLTVQHPPAAVVWRKMAQKDESPVRILEGRHTGLSDPHGITLDTKNQWLFVSNHGSVSYSKDGKYFSQNLPARPSDGVQQTAQTAALNWVVPNTLWFLGMAGGSGKFEPPSITAYPLKASGDTPPLRVIAGSKTQLNWPASLAMDSELGELYVANDMGDSILVFSAGADGNVEPKRVIKGPKSGVRTPIGVSIDLKNRELWVSNMGNHTATVYSLSANGDAAPLRTIRSAPQGTKARMIGNPGAVSYDSKREEILVPN